jgi:hypothetical protein
MDMRVYLVACLTAVVIALGALVLLSTVQKPSGTAFVGDGARVNPQWSFRQVISRAKPAPQNVSMVVPDSGNDLSENCDVANAWTWIMADFKPTPTDDPACSSTNQ